MTARVITLGGSSQQNLLLDSEGLTDSVHGRRWLGLATLSELGQGVHAEREMIGLDVKVDTMLVAKPLVKREMPRPIAVFVEPEGANASFGQRLRDQLKSARRRSSPLPVKPWPR